MKTGHGANFTDVSVNTQVHRGVGLGYETQGGAKVGVQLFVWKVIQ